MINPKKLKRVEVLAFKNALRLHNDAILLFKKRAYPSAIFLSILAQEEIGKMMMVGDYIFSFTTGTREPQEEERKLDIKWLELIYKHPHKQAKWLHQADEMLNLATPKKTQRRIEIILSGKLEKLKHRAMYVGLTKNGAKINVDGKIVSPFSIKKQEAARQITAINDFLIYFIVSTRIGYLMYDNELIAKNLNKRLYQELKKKWPKSRPFTRIILADSLKKLGYIKRRRI